MDLLSQIIIILLCFLVLIAFLFWKKIKNKLHKLKVTCNKINEKLSKKLNDIKKIIGERISHFFPFLILSIISIFLLNIIFTCAKRYKWGFASVLSYNETFSIIIAIATLMATVFIAVIQHDVHKKEIEKESKEDKIHAEEHRDELISNTLKNCVGFSSVAEFDYNGLDGFNIFVFPQKPEFFNYIDIEMSDESFNASEKTSQNKLTINVDGELAIINDFNISIKKENNCFIFDFTKIKNVEKIKKLIYIFFNPSKKSADYISFELKCKIKDNSIMVSESNNDENSKKVILQWNSMVCMDLYPIKKLSSTNKLKFNCIYKGGQT